MHDERPVPKKFQKVLFRQPNLLKMIEKISQQSQISAKGLEFEITESITMQDVKQTIEILNQMQSLGFKLSINDFGTGHSLLSYFKNFPINALKIDRSFVKDMCRSDDNAAIVRTIINLASSLHLSMVAEGVETEEQLNYLLTHHCSIVLGYYFYRACPAAEITRLLMYGNNLIRLSIRT